ncbi:trans-2,3-dihydro-3-hydroxyanthranilate isomerase [Ensifer adhaerens]|nr:trans-2,3-dihydro-3-hydroxyanthranilate isomerase [Ensifer adhaerens]
MARPYVLYDVFTDERLKGNPLAVVLEAEGLSEEDMQALAGEFNLSETVFVFASDNPAHTARLRIFTPGRELPFAGHPTVGTAIALAERAGGGLAIDQVSVLEEKVGPVRCAVRVSETGASFAEFDLPTKSSHYKLENALERQGIADALAISVKHVGFENHYPSVWSAGVPFLFVPVKDVATLAEVDFDPALWERVAPFTGGHLVSAYVYCRGSGASHFQARMFSPDMGIAEDPATGAAVAGLSGIIHACDRLQDGHHSFVIAQGVEMGRASKIHLHIDVTAGEISRARIGGQAVRVASGLLEI